MNEVVNSNERISAIPFNFALGANGVSAQSYTLSTGYDFDTAIFTASSTGTFQINIFDEFTRDNLFTGNVIGSLITGTGQLPFILPTHHHFGGGTTITITCTDTSGLGNNIQVVLIGNKIKKSIGGVKPTSGSLGVVSTAEQIKKQTLQYTIDRFMVIPFNFAFTGVAGAQYIQKYPVSGETSFMWDVLNSSYNIGGLRDFGLQIKDEFVTEEFFTSSVNASLITGNGQYPFVLPRPYVFQPRTTITVTATDTNGGAAINHQLIMIGYKSRKV